MQSPLERTIRERLAGYLTGQETLGEFKAWLVGETWGIDRAAEPAAVDLANRIKLILDEESGGFATEADVRNDLNLLLQPAHR